MLRAARRGRAPREFREPVPAYLNEKPIKTNNVEKGLSGEESNSKEDTSRADEMTAFGIRLRKAFLFNTSRGIDQDNSAVILASNIEHSHCNNQHTNPSEQLGPSNVEQPGPSRVEQPGPSNAENSESSINKAKKKKKHSNPERSHSSSRRRRKHRLQYPREMEDEERDSSKFYGFRTFKPLPADPSQRTEFRWARRMVIANTGLLASGKQTPVMASVNIKLGYRGPYQKDSEALTVAEILEYLSRESKRAYQALVSVLLRQCLQIPMEECYTKGDAVIILDKHNPHYTFRLGHDSYLCPKISFIIVGFDEQKFDVEFSLQLSFEVINKLPPQVAIDGLNEKKPDELLKVIDGMEGLHVVSRGHRDSFEIKNIHVDKNVYYQVNPTNDQDSDSSSEDSEKEDSMTEDSEEEDSMTEDSEPEFSECEMSEVDISESENSQPKTLEELQELARIARQRRKGCFLYDWRKKYGEEKIVNLWQPLIECQRIGDPESPTLFIASECCFPFGIPTRLQENILFMTGFKHALGFMSNRAEGILKDFVICFACSPEVKEQLNEWSLELQLQQMKKTPHHAVEDLCKYHASYNRLTKRRPKFNTCDYSEESQESEESD